MPRSPAGWRVLRYVVPLGVLQWLLLGGLVRNKRSPDAGAGGGLDVLRDRFVRSLPGSYKT
jgi:hypothetical protein